MLLTTCGSGQGHHHRLGPFSVQIDGYRHPPRSKTAPTRNTIASKESRICKPSG